MNYIAVSIATTLGPKVVVGYELEVSGFRFIIHVTKGDWRASETKTGYGVPGTVSNTRDGSISKLLRLLENENIISKIKEGISVYSAEDTTRPPL